MLNYKLIVTVTNQTVYLISLSRDHECNLSERHLWICGADSSDHFIILLHHFWKVRVEVIQTLTSFEKLETWVKRLFNPAARNEADHVRTPTNAEEQWTLPLVKWRVHAEKYKFPRSFSEKEEENTFLYFVNPYLFPGGASEDKKMMCKWQPIQRAESTTVNVTRIKWHASYLA